MAEGMGMAAKGQVKKAAVATMAVKKYGRRTTGRMNGD